MNRLELIAAAALLVMVTRADASGPGYVFDDPEVEPPQCHTLFGLPCHERQGGDDPLRDDDWTPPSAPTPKPKPQPPVECSLNEWTVGTQYANGGKPKKECA